MNTHLYIHEWMPNSNAASHSAERHGLGTDTFGLLIGSYLESIYLQIYCWPIANGETPNDMGKWIAWIIKWKFTIQRRNNSKLMYIGDWIYHCLGNIATSHYTGSIYIKCQSYCPYISPNVRHISLVIVTHTYTHIYIYGARVTYVACRSGGSPVIVALFIRAG